MDDRASATLKQSTPDGRSPCTKPYLLCELEVGKTDKLGNKVAEILWLARNYAIYLSKRGVYVHFSDCPQEEDDQRRRLTQISPQLCELRYLTAQMGWWWPFSVWRSPYSIYHHNMAQAVMLVMEDKNRTADLKRAKHLAEKTLNMAVERVTNDNMIRYVRACLFCWVALAVTSLWALWVPWPSWEAVRSHVFALKPFVVAGMFGATGAMLSVATRLQAFKLKPCHQSNMNYWMAVLRIGIGVVAGIVVVLLLARTVLSDPTGKHVSDMYWEAAAALGLAAGFTERLVPSLLQQTGNQLESAGTPVQATQQLERERHREAE